MTTTTTNSHKQFIATMQKLAQMQGASIDLLSLTASTSALDQLIEPIQTLTLVCHRMGLPKPKFFL